MRKIYLLLSAILALSAFFYVRWNGTEPTEIDTPLSDTVTELEKLVIVEEDVLPQGETLLAESLYQGAHGEGRIVDPALSYLQMALPQPLDEPWEAFSINSESVFRDEDSKMFTLSVLPNWIRNALREGKDEKAARFLNTLLLLVQDESLKVSDLAMTELYRLGDINEVAFREIGARLKDSAENFFYDDTNNYLEQRQQILNDLLFYDDQRYVDEIYALWQSQKEINSKSFPDFAYYLEEVGIHLPIDYWHGRIDLTANWENTYEVLHRKGNAATALKLEEYFLRTEKTRSRSVENLTRPAVAALLYELTGEPEYLEFVKAKAQHVQDNYGNVGIQKARVALTSLAKASPEEAKPFLRGTKFRGAIGPIALEALSLIPDNDSSDIISDEAIRIITEVDTFPKDALLALANQNTEYAASRYDEIRHALLSGNYGWTAPISKFDYLDFIRSTK